MATLDRNPSQKNPEFAWWRLRIKNGVKNASPAQLDDAIETYEAFELAFAGVVIAGVVAEFFIALAHPDPNSARGIWGPVIADAWVAVGLAVEVIAGVRVKLCQSELTRRSNDDLAEAKEKLAPRTLTPDQQQAVVDAISVFSGQKYSAVIAGGSPDAETFGLLLVEVLRRAGWYRTPHTGRLSAFPISLGSRPGVHVKCGNWEDEGTRTAAEKLAGALGLAGIVAKAGVDEENPEPNAIKITIGVKPL